MLALASCAEPPAPGGATASTSTSIATAPSEAPEDRDGTTVTPTRPATSATWDKTSTESATEVADEAMRLFVRRDVSPETWWRDLEPMMTAAAAQAYDGTDPASGAPVKITGKPAPVEGGSAYLARIHIPTNQGTYMVLLSRASNDEPWLVERFTPPENVGD